MFQRDSSIDPGPASNSIFSSRGKVVPVGLKPNLQGNNEHHESQKLTWEIEEGHSTRVKSQFLWDEVDANVSADLGTDAEFTGSRRELLNLNKVIDKQMQWASGENNQKMTHFCCLDFAFAFWPVLDRRRPYDMFCLPRSILA